MNTYTLVDPRPIAAEAPYTFFLPTDAELAAVARKDLVKLMFEYDQQTEKWSAERMWVTVEKSEGENFRGVLISHPDEPTSPLHAGDEISFDPHYILAIEWNDPTLSPQAPHLRQYWERCLVDDSVLNGEEPVEYIYREEPDMTEEGDTYPDSGWRIRGRMGNATDEAVEARSFSYVAIGAVLNRDDSWLGLIDAPIGARLMRDFGTNTYVTEL